MIAARLLLPMVGVETSGPALWSIEAGRFAPATSGAERGTRSVADRSTLQVPLSDATALTKIGDDRYVVDLSRAWAAGVTAHGGYLLAVVARVAIEASPYPHPIAVSAHFASASNHGPAEVSVEAVKVGRTTATYRCSLRQGTQRRVEAIVTTGQMPKTPSAQWVDTKQIAIAPLAQCQPMDATEGSDVALFDNLEIRLDPGPMRCDRGSRGSMESRAWMRLRDGSVPDPLALLVLADAMPPPVFKVGRFRSAPTVQMAPLLRVLPCGKWIQVTCRGRLLADGWVDADAALWDESGSLVMQARQLALAMPLD